MATTVAILEAKLRADTRDFDSGMASADRSMSVARKGVLIGAGAIVGGVGLMAKSAINAAADYEKSMNVLQAVSGATGEQMKDLSKEARKLGADTKLPGTSARDAATAMTELAKAGFNVDQVMQSTRATLLLSAAAEVSNERAAEIAANAVNSFGIKAARTNVVVDQLANVANASSVSMEQAADSMQMASAVFSGFQKPTLGAEGAMRELNIAIGILANAGIKGSDAGTSLKQALLQLTGPAGKTKNMMRDLYLATGEGARGSQLLETSVHGLTKTIRDEASIQLEKLYGSTKGVGDIAFTAAGKMRPLHEIVGMVTKATRGMTDEQKAYYVTQIFGADASRAIIALMNAQAEGWDKMGTAIDKTGSAQAVADAKMKGFRGTMESLKSSIETLQVEFGLMLLPVVTKFAEILVRGTTVIGQHRIATVVVTTAITAFAVALGVAAVAGMLLRSTLVTAVIPAIIRTTVVQWLLNVALTANPISLVVLALAALAAAFIIAWQRSETFRNIVKGLWEVLKITPLGLVISHLDDVARKMGAAGEKAVAFGKMAVGPIDAVADSFRSVWRWIDKIIDGIKWLIDKIPSISKIPLIGGGDPFDPRKLLPPQGPVGAGRMDISPKLWDELSAAQSFGLGMISGYRPGAITASGKRSDHSYYPSKAIDVSGSAGAMARFFTWLIGQRDVKQAFYDPLGSIFNGVLSNYREGGHSDHVHVATYDRGGFLRPGWNLAYNGLGRPEPVGAGTVNFNFPNYVGSKQELVSWLQNAAQEFKRRNGRGLV